MKRPLKLPLAIALALSGTDAFALGLGTIHVNSKLNQPLDAEIPIIQGTAGEAEGLLVQLAAAEDFDRVGLNRSRLSVPLEFSLIKGSHGDMVIKVTSKEVVREPFLDFLVEANWPKGRLLREYTVLLDPPLMAPATGTSAVATAAKTPERAPTQPLPESKPKAAPPKPKAAPVAAAPRSEPPPAKAAPAAPPPKHAGVGEYTVEAGDTLSGIARDVRPDETTNINQLMLALLKQNPNAFYKDNINALKRGSILRIPSADQIKTVASASEAAAQVHSQIEDWRGGAAAKPTLVADTGAASPAPKTTPPAAKPASTSTTSTSKTPSERLELVPPKAGKDQVAVNDRPGTGSSAGGTGSTEIKAELARTKEALTSREQEAGELKSRVKELEDTKSKSDRLLSLKDSEIADLQKKLKELQEQGKAGAKTAATTPATTPPAATATPSATTTSSTTPANGTASKGDKVSKEDIWGTASAPPDAKTPGTTTPSSTTGTAATTPSSTTGTSSTTASTTPAATGSATTPSNGTTPPTSTAASASTGSTSTSTPSSSATTPESTTGSTTPSTPDTTTPSSVASTTPAAGTMTPKPSATTSPVTDAKIKAQPLPPSTPAWYEQSWLKPAAIGAGALLLLAGLLAMRKRKAAAQTPARGSIAGAFADSPIGENGLGTITTDSEEGALREQLELDPGNVGLHLELLSLLYAERDVGAFEDAAEAMHANVVDPHQPEWLEARAMGQELAPHNPLFTDDAPAHDVFDDEAVTARHAHTPFDHDDVFHHDEAPPPAAQHASTAFDFDLDEPASAAPTTPPPSEAAFSFDSLPPIDFGKEAVHEIETAVPPPLQVDEDEFPGEDGVGTKLDLAKAYLDMGDPEGARSMLDEVLAEGNDVQKGEARRLMAEIR